jgi:hypothetical protein
MSEHREKKRPIKFHGVLAAEINLLKKLRASGKKSEHQEKEAEKNSEEAGRIPDGACQYSNSHADEPDSEIRKIYADAHKADLAGLALSGGGIRSATFNLGVIQALANNGLLSKFDYLSTVSGGGYIGAWLSSLVHRCCNDKGDKAVDEKLFEEFQPSLRTHPCKPLERKLGSQDSKPNNPGQGNITVPAGLVRCKARAGFKENPWSSGFEPVEHAAVRFLRRYSNYLTPRVGLSGDALAVVSIFLRNFVLLQFSLISLLSIVILLAYTIGMLSMELENWSRLAYGSIGGGVFCLLMAIFYSFRSLVEPYDSSQIALKAALSVTLKIVLPLLLASWLLIVGFVAAKIPSELEWNVGIVVVTVIAYWIASRIGYFYGQNQGKNSSRSEEMEGQVTPSLPFPYFYGPLIAGLTLGLLLIAGANYLSGITEKPDFSIWPIVALGPPLFLLGCSLVITVHMGVAKDSFHESQREWWARLGGYLLYSVVAWTLVFAVVLYASPFVKWLGDIKIPALISWAIGSGLGAWFASGSDTDTQTGGVRWKDILARIIPWLFLGGLVLIIAHVVFLVVVEANLEELVNASVLVTPVSSELIQPGFMDWAAATTTGLERLSWLCSLIALGVMIIVFLLMNLLLDINLFSAHTLYKNRLTRAYIGASRAGERRPHPFTGFDPKDDMNLHDLATQRPIPLLNTSINMTGGDDLAWQTRRAASFTFTPCWSGYEAKTTGGSDIGGYRPTAEYGGGMKLGTVVAISGAAVSPNMGYHTSTAVSALLTAFNFRLGYWAGNTREEENSKSALGKLMSKKEVWEKTSPTFAARPLLSELFGAATGKADWINLTDGGHFDNLGVYELVRRRCRLVLVTDAGCDPKHYLEDLANVIRKCWTDFGVDINFRAERLDRLRLKEGERFCQRHGAVGDIRYPDGPDGVIIYLKSSLTDDAFPEIREYADKHPDFPHESTVDQFFDENQFEAYRHLGYHVAVSAVDALHDFFGSRKMPEDVYADDQSSL